jgi:hypothetical protein
MLRARSPCICVALHRAMQTSTPCSTLIRMSLALDCRRLRLGSASSIRRWKAHATSWKKQKLRRTIADRTAWGHAQQRCFYQTHQLKGDSGSHLQPGPAVTSVRMLAAAMQCATSITCHWRSAEGRNRSLGIHKNHMPAHSINETSLLNHEQRTTV